MSGRAESNYLIQISLLLILFFGIGSIAHSQCTRMAVTVVSTSVYDRAPIFSSRTGWQLGNIITNLPADTSVRVCEEVTVGLFFDKKKWYRIEFDTGRCGWVFSGQLDISTAPIGDSNYIGSIVITEAHAQAASTNGSDHGIPGFNIWIMSVIAFVFVVFGMIGKVAYDELDIGQRPSLRSTFNLWKCLKALIVAPIVFGAFLTVGKFSFENEIAVIIFFCLAFQNGFFWQTVLPTGEVVPKTA
jgi:hypothetical protein